MRFTESRRGQGYAKPRLVLSRRREQARGLHANERSTRTSFCRKESTSFWHARIAARFGGRTRPRDSIRILQVFMNSQMEALFGLKGRRTAVLGLAYAPWQKLSRCVRDVNLVDLATEALLLIDNQVFDRLFDPASLSNTDS